MKTFIIPIAFGATLGFHRVPRELVSLTRLDTDVQITINMEKAIMKPLKSDMASFHPDDQLIPTQPHEFWGVHVTFADTEDGIDLAYFP